MEVEGQKGHFHSKPTLDPYISDNTLPFSILNVLKLKNIKGKAEIIKEEEERRKLAKSR